MQLQPCEYLAPGGSQLRSRCCLGEHARYDRLDTFGRRMRVPCCRGNTFAVMGGAPRRSTVAQCAEAMGLDIGHMGFDRMAKAIPPAYASYTLGAMVRHVLQTRFGIRALSFDEARSDWPAAQRQMRLWIRGAGGVSPTLGLRLEAPREQRDAKHSQVLGGVGRCRKSPSCAPRECGCKVITICAQTTSASRHLLYRSTDKTERWQPWHQ